MSEWTKTEGKKPNLDGTEVGSLVEKLKVLSSYYEGQLTQELSKLEQLNNLKTKYELQRKSRKVDPNA